MNWIALITALVQAYELIGKQIQSASAAAATTGELTPEQHASIVAYMDGEAARPEWIPEKVIPPGPPGPPDRG